MRQSIRQRSLIGLGLGSLLLSFGCNDYLTGQLEEPAGPLQVLRLTLFDSSSRNAPVFTDTSLPDCSKAPNCEDAANRETSICRICYNDVFKDMYSPQKSPPTPLSGEDIRVIFNKIPLKLSGQDLPYPEASNYQSVLAMAVNLECSGCTLPKFTRNLVASGSSLSFDPTSIPYGPSLQLQLDQGDDTKDPPLAALDPDTTYTVKVNGALAGRDGNVIDQGSGANLLTFKTEPFKALALLRPSTKARTNAMDPPQKWADCWALDDAKACPSGVSELPTDGAVRLTFNAPLHAGTLAAAMLTATRKDGMPAIPVTLSTNTGATDAKTMACKRGNRRNLYITPTAGSWPTDVEIATVVIPKDVVKDLTQGTWAVGRHAMASDLTLTIQFTKKAADADFQGLKISSAKAQSACM